MVGTLRFATRRTRSHVRGLRGNWMRAMHR
jgi:hypothetical protein